MEFTYKQRSESSFFPPFVYAFVSFLDGVMRLDDVGGGRESVSNL